MLVTFWPFTFMTRQFDEHGKQIALQVVVARLTQPFKIAVHTIVILLILRELAKFIGSNLENSILK